MKFITGFVMKVLRVTHFITIVTKAFITRVMKRYEAVVKPL